MDKTIIKISYLAMLISGLSIILVIGVLFLKPKEEKTMVAWCGVQDTPGGYCGTSKLYNNKGEGMKGELLFKNNCSSCHSLYEVVVGPPLAGVSERRPKKWIRRMIKDGNSLKDEYTIALRKKYNDIPHLSFPFSNEEINEIIAYLDSTSFPKY